MERKSHSSQDEATGAKTGHENWCWRFMLKENWMSKSDIAIGYSDLQYVNAACDSLEGGSCLSGQ